MDIEKLLGMSADEIEKASAEQIQAYFESCHHITHPDKLSEPPQQHNVKKIARDDNIDTANKLLQQFGINFKIKK